MLIRTILPYNPVISYMKYSNETLTIGFKKAKGVIQERSYFCDKETAYMFYYSKTAEQTLSFFSNNIKGKLKLINVNLR